MPRLLCLWPAGFLVLLLCSAPARARDIAELLPADTLAYFGWSEADKLAGDEIKLVRSLCEDIASTAPEHAAEEVAAVRELVNMLMTGLEGSGGLALLDLRVGTANVGVDAVIIIDAGPKSATYADRLTAAVGKLSPTTELESVPVGGGTAQRLSLPDTGDAIYFTTRDNLFIASLGQRALETALSRLTPGAESLARSPGLTAARQKVKANAAAPHLSAHIDVQAIFNKIKPTLASTGGPPPEMVDRIMEALGLSAVRDVHLHADATPRGLHSRLFIRTAGERRGLLKIWNQKPITDDDLKIIPANAYWASVSNFDLAAFWSDLKETVEEIEPGSQADIQQGLGLANQFLGLSVEADLLPAFGDTWTLLDAPAHGGFLIVGIVAIIETKDATRLSDMFEHLFTRGDALASMAEGAVSVQIARAKRGDYEIEYAIVSGLPIPFAPAWTVVDGRVIFGLSPQSVAAAAAGVDSRVRKTSILDNADFKAARALMPADAISVSYSDTKRWARLYYPFGTMIATAALSMSGAKPESQQAIAALPLLSETLERTHNAVQTCSVDNDGILYSYVGSGLSPATVVAAMLVPVGIISPSAVLSGRAQGARAASMSNLRTLGMGCMMYANEHNKLPAKIEDIGPYVWGDEEAGFEKMMHSPRDPSGATRYIYITGQRYLSNEPTTTVLMYEPLIGGQDGSCVLFLDGHVAWLEGEELRSTLQKNYADLKRANELDPSLRPASLR